MELRHLRYFVMVAEELHFGRAADRLGIAQPPLSQQIKALEEEIGVHLLSRTSRRVELTTPGAFYLNEARKILAHVERAGREARKAARGEIGLLEVGFVSSAVYDRVPLLFRLMRSRYPEVTLVLQDLTTEEQVEAMKAQRLDVGLVRPPVPNAESLAIRVFWREPMVVALPQAHPLAKLRRIPIEALEEESFLQVSHHAGPGYYDQFIRICAQAGFSPRVVQEARTSQTVVSLIAGGMGVSLVPDSMRNFKRAGVVYRRLKPPEPTVDMAVMWRPDDESPALRSFLEIVLEMAEV
ncbi:MAG: LysR family transcriptional regulator [Syntrophobacteraceae bacterium]|nr:LysR family transcriptional regulator [Desulfobacteraceae bacterium]